MLPVLDLSDADANPASFRSRLREAAHDSGFFYLVGHGVPQTQFDELLGLARQFFALPVDTKNEISQFKSPQFRGYSRLGGELTNGSVDWREQIDIGPERQVIDGAEGYWRLQGPNLWPAEPPGFREAFEGWDAALSEVGLRLLRHWAVSLGADETRLRHRVRRSTRNADQGGALSRHRRDLSRRWRAQGFGRVDTAAGRAGVGGLASRARRG